ncbi:MAG TPA: multiheme c-type cytochrome, partial [Polyangiaceae bacterium]|nr:multiheme c-type cytochrome [Polyangiaceae bacterium]
MRHLLVTVLITGLAAVALSGCDGTTPPLSDADAGGPVTALTQEQLMDPRTCQGCHPMHYEEWRGSMHAYASMDPVFHAMNQKGQQETAGALGDFCVSCHAP